MSSSKNETSPHRDESTQQRSVQPPVSLINRSILIAILLLFAARVLEQTATHSTFAVVLPLSVVMSGICLALANGRHASSVTTLLEAICASVVVCASLIAVNPLGSYPELWAGFGPVVLLIELSSIGLFLIWSRLRVSGLGKNHSTKVLEAVSVLFILLYLPVLIQPNYALLNLGDTTYHVLDEILAPLVGKIPYFDYSPQYTTIYGWLLYPLKTLEVPAELMMSIVIFLCNFLIFSVLLVVVRITKNVIPESKIFPALLATVSIFYVSGSSNGASVLMKEFSAFGRLLPLLLSYLVLTTGSLSSALLTKRRSYLLGLSIGFAFLNNPEMGGLALCSFLISIAVPVKRSFVRLKDPLFVVGAAGGVALTYFLVGLLIKGEFNFSSVIGIRLRGTSLYPDTRFSLFGAHVISMGLCIAAISRGFQIQLKDPSSSNKQRIAFLEICSGLTLGGLLVKFFSFPVGPGVRELLVPSFLTAVFIFADLRQELRTISSARWKQYFSLVPTLLIAFLPIGALTQVPYPIDELRRIVSDHSGETNWSSTPGRPSDGWSVSYLDDSYGSLTKRTSEIARTLDHSTSEVAYFGIFGNTVELITGVKSGLGIAAPESLKFGGNQPKLACTPIERDQPRYVIVYLSKFPCLGYELRKNSDFEPFQIYVKSN